MSDPQLIDSSHKSPHDRAGETTLPVDNDRPSQRHDHGSAAHFSSSGTAGAAKLTPGTDSTAPPHQDMSTASPGVFASALHNATETIKHYLPSQHPSSSPESAPHPTKRERRRSSGGAIHKTAGSLKESMPVPIASKLPGDTAVEDSPLPSKEIPGGSRVGVGSLPGHLSEISVAKLPEERRQENLPSHETDHERLGKTGGVGPLPGGPNESSVALLPEERAHPAYETLSGTELVESGSGSVAGTAPLAGEVRQGVLPSHESGNERPGDVGPPSGGPSESKVAVLPEERSMQSEMIEKSESRASGQLPTTTGAVPTSYGSPVQLGDQHNGSPAVPPRSSEPDTSASGPLQKPQEVEKTEEADAKRTDKPQDPESHIAMKRSSQSADGEYTPGENAQDTSIVHEFRSAPVAGDPVPAVPHNSPVTMTRKHRESTGSSSAQRVGFVEKMKGEAMIISGKLGKNEKKVEEGKSLMGK